MNIPVAHGLLYVPFSILSTLFVNSLSVIPNSTHLFSTPLAFLLPLSTRRLSALHTLHSTFSTVSIDNRCVCLGGGGGRGFKFWSKRQWILCYINYSLNTQRNIEWQIKFKYFAFTSDGLVGFQITRPSHPLDPPTISWVSYFIPREQTT